MSRTTIATGAALLMLWAAPSGAQQRGTVEFGAFGSAGSFNKSLTLDRGFGGGGRVGVYLEPRLSLEFEKAEMRATRTLGLNDVNVGLLSARITAVPLKSGAFSVLLGAGAGAGTETNFLHSYGVNGLLGVKVALSNSVALRIDAVADWLANYDWKSFQSVHAGLSLYRNPFMKTRTVTVQGPPAAPVMMSQRPDSVSADEQARLRRTALAYRALRDSLDRPKASTATSPSSASALAAMEEHIYFATDKSDLSAEARRVLDTKVAVFRANPAMRIVILGNTDERATDAYNMALGRRRAEAAKAYLVAQGIDPVRVEITSHGERKPAAAGTTPAAQGLNRRDEFRLLLASDYLVAPKP